MSDKVYDLKGAEKSGKVRIVIRPGFGIRLPNPDPDTVENEPFRHFGYEDGAIDVPVGIAADMLHDGRAFAADDDDQPVDAEGAAVNTTVAAEAVEQVNAASPSEVKVDGQAEQVEGN